MTGSRSVLVVDHTSAPGGAELALPRIASQSRHDLTFLFLEPGADQLGFPKESRVLAPRKKMGTLGQIWFLRKSLRLHSDALIVSNSLRSALFVRFTKKPRQRHVFLLQDGVGATSLSAIKRVVFDRMIVPGIDQLLPNSAWTASTVADKFAAKVGPVIYSASGQDESTPPRQIDQPRTGLTLLSLSRVVEWKGIHILLDALDILEERIPIHELRVIIAGSNVMGSDKYLESIRHRVELSKFSIRMVGQRSDVQSLLFESDVLAHAAIRPEPFGQVIVQGMRSGLIVIASDAGGPSELIEDGVSGFLYPMGDAVALAETISFVLDNPQRRSTIANNAEKFSARFADAAVVRLFDDAIEKSH